MDSELKLMDRQAGAPVRILNLSFEHMSPRTIGVKREHPVESKL